MIINSLELSDYRNYEKLELSFDRGINIFYGDNAQGKTNILEAIYLCCTNKSHRGSKDKDIIRFGMDESHLKLLLSKDGRVDRIDMHLRKNKSKGIAINGIPIRKASELFGIINVVLFSPEDLQIIKNGPAERRRFIDLELCQLDKYYVNCLVNYNKTLAQRNALLKSIACNPSQMDTLLIWNEILVKYGVEIIKIREQFIQKLNAIIGNIHFKLSGGKENIEICYEPNIDSENFLESLEKNRERDIRQKMTLIGPHRDDISFIVNEIDIRKYGSQGQQRTAALSLKMAEIELVKQHVKDSPILLLDDVLSELDANRQTQLLDSIDGIQTMITCTGLDDFVNHRFHIDKIFRVVSGAVTKEN